MSAGQQSRHAWRTTGSICGGTAAVCSATVAPCATKSPPGCTIVSRPSASAAMDGRTTVPDAPPADVGIDEPPADLGIDAPTADLGIDEPSDAGPDVPGVEAVVDGGMDVLAVASGQHGAPARDSPRRVELRLRGRERGGARDCARPGPSRRGPASAPSRRPPEARPLGATR